MKSPKLIVFDFHGTLSLATGREKNIGDFEETLKKEDYDVIKINNLKNALRKYKKDGWYSAMKESNIDPEIMMPTLKDVISFVEQMGSETRFGIASMGEDENFIYDMMKYCFESLGKESPFSKESIIGFQSLRESEVKSSSAHDKFPHIALILKRLNMKVEPEKIVLFDDNLYVLEEMTNRGICCIYVENFFRLSDWKKGCFKIGASLGEKKILSLLSLLKH